MIEIAHFFKAVKRLLLIFKKFPEFAELCPAAQAIQNHMRACMHHHEIKQLLDILFTKTFTGAASPASHQGRVLVAYRLMHLLKKEFEPLLLHLGQLDALLSCATLYKEFEPQRVKYSFAEYKEASLPSIYAVNFWNPLISSDVVVPNSVQLGEQERKNMIITGPNAGENLLSLRDLLLILFWHKVSGL